MRGQEVTPLAVGALVRDSSPDAVIPRWTAISGDGTVRWTRAFAGAASPVIDDARRVFYIQAGASVVARDLQNGARRWATKPSETARLLAVGRDGSLYVAITRAGWNAIRAMSSTGMTRWQFDTASTVSSAARMSDATVVFTTDGLRSPSHASPGLVWRVDPRHTARRITGSPRITAPRRVPGVLCNTPGCQYRADVGMTIRTRLPRRAVLRLTLRTRAGLVPLGTIRAPAGAGAVRIMLEARRDPDGIVTPIPRGPATLLARGSDGRRLISQRLPVRIG